MGMYPDRRYPCRTPRSSDLPDSVKNVLPAHAQDIFKATFNSAWDEYGHDEQRSLPLPGARSRRAITKTTRPRKWEKGASTISPPKVQCEPGVPLEW